MTTTDWNKILKSGFKVPGPHPVYVLGCFARHVTLYSQQVRAMNLVYGLFKTGKLAHNMEIAVVGGGAAGLTAAAAAAYRGARVSLFDEVEGPMELQQNNRQRWIHPYIYDWPYPDKSFLDQFQTGDAGLPLLTWRADYAANVAGEITSQWDRMRSAYAITTNWSVRNLELDLSRRHHISLKWDDGKNADFSIVILAVGFGLEQKGHGQDSYWTEDDLDGGFRKPPKPVRWLLSGSGDGALTDLMRLCVHRFRQDEMLNLFVSAQGIEGLKSDLRDLQEKSGQLNAKQVSGRFAELGIDNELRELVKEQLRHDGPNVSLVTDSRHLYGPKTSILNRLVVRILDEMKPKIFEHVVGHTDGVSPKGNGFEVKIKTQGKTAKHHFDRVLIRHGPESKLKSSFPSIYGACGSMEKFWKNLSVGDDITRRPNWRANYFGRLPKLAPSKVDQPASAQTAVELETQDPDFAISVKRFGVYAERVGILKQIRSDGSSTVTYTIDGLSVVKGSISGVHFVYNSAAGTIDRTQLESAPRGFKWIDDDDDADLSQLPYAKKIEEARNRARRLSGTVQFSQPLRPNKQVSFRLSFRLLNGDALSDWEFFQMYDAEGRVHVDSKRLTSPTDYLARTVWFPTQLLTIRVFLPTAIRDCIPSVFLYPNHKNISRGDVVNESILHFSRPLKKKKPMLAIAKPLRPPRDFGLFRKISLRGWEFSVPVPAVGSCYTIDWPLPVSPTNDFTHVLEEDSRRFRKALMHYRSQRRNDTSAGPSTSHRNELVTRLFKRFYRSLADRDQADDEFVILFLAYLEHKQRLVVVDGIRNGGDLSANTRDFWLRFGLGLAGSCFKSGHRVFVLSPQQQSASTPSLNSGKDTPEKDPGFYLHIPGDSRPKFLLQIPIEHPLFTPKNCPANYEASRQRVGVISIASRQGKTWLAGIKEEKEFKRLQRWCQGLCNDVYGILTDNSGGK
jgi:hypothetical protein